MTAKQNALTVVPDAESDDHPVQVIRVYVGEQRVFEAHSWEHLDEGWFMTGSFDGEITIERTILVPDTGVRWIEFQTVAI